MLILTLTLTPTQVTLSADALLPTVPLLTWLPGYHPLQVMLSADDSPAVIEQCLVENADS